MAVVLVSGFGPFPGVPVNASGALARAADRARIGPWQVVGVEVETSWHRAWPALLAAAERVQPELLVMFGVAPREQVEVERVARNVAAPRPDCDGQGPSGPRLVESGPDQLFTTLPLDLVPTSESAGDYLCNALFYQARLHLPVPGGFVHIPHEGLWAGLRVLGRLLRATPPGGGVG